MNKTEKADLARFALWTMTTKKPSGGENPLQIQSSQLEEWHSLDAFQLGLTPFSI